MSMRLWNLLRIAGTAACLAIAVVVIGTAIMTGLVWLWVRRG